MTEFDNLKSSYAFTIHCVLTANAGYHDIKQENAVLHKFCESLIEKSNYPDSEKETMKYELELLKEALSKEIDHYYKSNS